MRGCKCFLGPARWAVAAAVALAAAGVLGADAIKGVGPFNPQDETVELFAGIADGRLEAKLIPRDASECRLLVTNKTQKPLNVAMPEAFAGVPVVAQLQWPPQGANNIPGIPGGNNRNAANAGAPQTLGIGNQFGNLLGNNAWGNPGNRIFNLPGAGNVLPGRGPGVPQNFAGFNVAPEKVAQLKLPSVCLEYGKPTPRPKMSYRPAPIESVARKAEVQELCRMLGRGEISQQAAQAAAWHLAGDMSWEQLAGLRVQKLPVGSIGEPMFSRQTLAAAKQAAEAAIEATSPGRKPGKSESLSMR